MASPSSFTSRNYSYNVFASFHGADVRKTLLSHIREQFKRSAISMFDDQKIERGATIDPSLKKAIKESRISIVILSKKYSSSGWCLDELVEIMECKKTMGQIVMTIFYGVEPSHVRKQTGEFGIAFSETCARKKPTDEERLKWINALNDVGNIEGEDFLRWDNEANMIKKIAKDVLDKLNATPSKDFDGMVGLEAHLREMQVLLDLDNDVVKMVAISGPAGIGKTTIARALHNLLWDRFQLTCFVDNLKGSYSIGLDEYGLKLRLQEQFLSDILNQSGMTICHLGAVEERLRDQKVLIILDDVNNIKQLEALANKTTWFGLGSRIVVTTENKELLEQHGIDDTYHVRFPSRKEALDILCRYAFRERSHHYGFEELALKVIKLCGKLPLGLRVVGSTLRGKNKEEWKQVICRLETIFDYGDIEEVLRVGYESLYENEQSLFLHIAVFFNYNDGDLVKAMFADNNLDIKYGLKILTNRSLIHVSKEGKIVMHKLLQQVGAKVVHKEEPWKRRILIDAQVICDVLERAKGTREVSGISFDISDIDEICINERAFKRMPNLRFLKIYKSKDDGNDVLHIPKEMELPRRLRLLHWKAYPSKSLPLRFCVENLVELNMRNSWLEKLWEGTQPLTNLKKLDLSQSFGLKELPDLSNAAMLESLKLNACVSLVEIHSSIGNLHKIDSLDMGYCKKLQVVPSGFNVASFAGVDMEVCTQLRNLEDVFTNIRFLTITDTMLEELAKISRSWSAIKTLRIFGYSLTRDDEYIERIPDWIKNFCGLEWLHIYSCPKLVSLPELPASLRILEVISCESLKTVSLDCDHPKERSLRNFTNCIKLDREAREALQQSSYSCLPGREIPAEFDHRALKNSLTIRSDCREFRICIVIFPKQVVYENSQLLCRVRINKGCLTDYDIYMPLAEMQGEHLFIFYTDLVGEDEWLEQDNEIMFEFIPTCQEVDIIECGVQIMTMESEYRRWSVFYEARKLQSLKNDYHRMMLEVQSLKRRFFSDFLFLFLFFLFFFSLFFFFFCPHGPGLMVKKDLRMC